MALNGEQFEEYLRGGSALSRGYRELSSEPAGVVPTPESDAAIRAAARREVGARPTLAGSPFSRSWYVPLSLAAVVVLSITLTWVVEREAPPEGGFPAARPGAISNRAEPMSAPPAQDALMTPQSAEGAAEESSRAAVPAAPVAKTRAADPDLERRQTPAKSEKPKRPQAAPQRARDKDAQNTPSAFPSNAKQEATSGPEPAPVGPPAPMAQSTTAADGAGVPSSEQAIQAGDAPPKEARADAALDAALPTPKRQLQDEQAVAAATGASADEGPAPAASAPAAVTESAGSTPGRNEARAPATAAEPAGESADSPHLAHQSLAKTQVGRIAAGTASARERAAAPGAEEGEGLAARRSESDLTSAAARDDAADWVKRIFALQRQGRMAEAKLQLRKFVEKYPDYKLPEALTALRAELTKDR